MRCNSARRDPAPLASVYDATGARHVHGRSVDLEEISRRLGIGRDDTVPNWRELGFPKASVRSATRRCGIGKPSSVGRRGPVASDAWGECDDRRTQPLDRLMADEGRLFAGGRVGLGSRAGSSAAATEELVEDGAVVLDDGGDVVVGVEGLRPDLARPAPHRMTGPTASSVHTQPALCRIQPPSTDVLFCARGRRESVRVLAARSV